MYVCACARLYACVFVLEGWGRGEEIREGEGKREKKERRKGRREGGKEKGMQRQREKERRMEGLLCVSVYTFACAHVRVFVCEREREIKREH